MKLEDPIVFGKAVADVIAEPKLAADGERYEVIRSGERPPIPAVVRLLVWRRDQGTCRLCHVAEWSVMELDHIVPWSAGGPDRASNLRVTCRPCNQGRSNRREIDGPRLRSSVTPCCDRCVDRHHTNRSRSWWRTHQQVADRMLADGLGAGCGGCPTDDVRVDEWDPPAIAWCGLCESLSAVSGRGRIL